MRLRIRVNYSNISLRDIFNSICTEFEKRHLFISNQKARQEAQCLLNKQLSHNQLKIEIRSLATSYEVASEFNAVKRGNWADTRRTANY